MMHTTADQGAPDQISQLKGQCVVLVVGGIAVAVP